MQYMICRKVPNIGMHYDSREYERYTQKIASKLPEQARNYALAPWHYDHQNHQCLHDAWLESFSVSEAEDYRLERRLVNSELKLLGAYHDGQIVIQHRGIREYSFNIVSQSQETHLWHGNVLTDEVLWIESKNTVSHEVLFEQGTLLVVCDEIIFEWIPSNLVSAR